MTYVIEDGVPLPSGTKQENGITGTIRRLAVGQSFLVPDTDGTRNAVYTGAKNAKCKVSIRRVGDGQLRVWRVA